MIVAFFADDASASHAALLTARGLATVERPTTLIQFVHRGAIVLRAPSCASLITVERVDPCSDPQPGLRRRLDQAERNNADVIFIAPLNLMGSLPLPGSGHLPVLPCGATFMGTVATRRTIAQAANAASAMARGDAPSPGRDTPPWLLPWGGGNAAGVMGEPARRQLTAREDRVRLLPVTMPFLRRSDAAALLNGSPAQTALRSGVLLAAVLEAAAADPLANHLDRAALIDMMDPGPAADERRLSEKLLALADMFDLLSDQECTIPAMVPASRRRGTLGWHPAPSAQSARPRMARASRPARQAATVRDFHQRTPMLAVTDPKLSLRRS